MARIKGKDLYLKDDDQIYFGDAYDAAMWYYDGELRLNHTLSGIAPVNSWHLTTKQYVDELVSTISGSISGSFLGLLDVPTTYSGQAGKSLVVNDDEDGLIFASVTFGNIDGGLAASTYGGTFGLDGGNAY